MEPKGRLYGIPDVMEDIKIIVAMIQAKGMRGKIIRNTKKNKKGLRALVWSGGSLEGTDSGRSPIPL